MRHADIRPEDAFVASYPKSGTTWLRFMLGQLLSNREMDFDTAETMIPMVGWHRDAPRVLPGEGRLVKTHESYRNVYRKAVYMVRDARDVVISYYHHQVRQGLFEGDLSTFVARFLDGRTDGYGVWHRHVASWLDSPIDREGGLLVVRYETMRRDPLDTMRQVVSTLGLTLPDEAIRRVIETNTMERMRAKEASATVIKKKRDDIPIVRRGRPGEWREVLTERDRAAFLRRAGPMLARLRYDTEGG
jgi:hypothetical protein